MVPFCPDRVSVSLCRDEKGLEGSHVISGPPLGLLWVGKCENWRSTEACTPVVVLSVGEASASVSSRPAAMVTSTSEPRARGSPSLSSCTNCSATFWRFPGGNGSSWSTFARGEVFCFCCCEEVKYLLWRKRKRFVPYSQVVGYLAFRQVEQVGFSLLHLTWRSRQCRQPGCRMSEF